METSVRKRKRLYDSKDVLFSVTCNFYSDKIMLLLDTVPFINTSVLGRKSVICAHFNYDMPPLARPRPTLSLNMQLVRPMQTECKYAISSTQTECKYAISSTQTECKNAISSTQTDN